MKNSAIKAIIKASKISGSIAAPPSKSMAHRLLIAAGLAQGTSRISNIQLSEDIQATMRCLKALGAEISALQDDADDGGYAGYEIKGIDPATSSSAVLDCGESGSTLRFLIPIAALSDNEMILQGSSMLLSRPLSVYEDIFSSESLVFEKNEREVRLQGRLSGGEFIIPGDISSQFVSGLMMALPLAVRDSLIKLTGHIESRPYIDMSISALRAFGIDVQWTDERSIFIRGGQSYHACDISVEGDWSNAAYLMALGAVVTGLDSNSLQGDRVCRDYFGQLRDGYADLDISSCPDLGPVLMAYAAMHHGCTLRGTKRLKIKESDRGATMQQELAKFGVSTGIYDNMIKVGCGISKPKEALHGHNDHRIVMALTALCIAAGGIIEGSEAVNKSYPDFFDKIKEVGADIKLEDIA